MDILTLNCGSSSLKYPLYRWDDRDALARGIVERVGFGGSFINHFDKPAGRKVRRDHDCPTHMAPDHAEKAFLYVAKRAAVPLGMDPFRTNLGIVADPSRNELSVTRNAETEITGAGSRTRILVIPTDEELVMTEDTCALLKGTYDVHTRGCANKAREQMLVAELKEKPGLAEVIVRPR